MSDLNHTITNDKFKTKKPCGYEDSLVTVYTSGILKIGNFNNKALLAIIAVLTILLFIK